MAVYSKEKLFSKLNGGAVAAPMARPVTSLLKPRRKYAPSREEALPKRVAPPVKEVVPVEEALPVKEVVPVEEALPVEELLPVEEALPMAESAECACNGRCVEAVIPRLERVIYRLDKIEARQAMDRKMIDEVLMKVGKATVTAAPVEIEMQIEHTLKQWLVTAQLSGKTVAKLAGVVLVLLDTLIDSDGNLKLFTKNQIPNTQYDFSTPLMALSQLTGEAQKPVEIPLKLPKDALRKWFGIAQASGQTTAILAGALASLLEGSADLTSDSAVNQPATGMKLDLSNLLATINQYI